MTAVGREEENPSLAKLLREEETPLPTKLFREEDPPPIKFCTYWAKDDPLDTISLKFLNAESKSVVKSIRLYFSSS